MSGTVITARTLQDNIISNVTNQKNELYKLAQQTSPDSPRFKQTSNMTREQSQQFAQLQNNTAHITQLQGNAHNFLNKVDLAIQSVSTIQTKLFSVSQSLAANTNLTPDARNVLKTTIQDALRTMQAELNSSCQDGYLFASSSNRNQVPITDIVNNINYGSDGTPNTSYVTNPSTSNTLTVSDGINFSTDIDPANPAFRDSIAALHKMLDALNRNLPAIPDSAVTLFQTAQSEMRNFLANDLKNRYDNTLNAIEKNEAIQDSINEQIDETYKSNPIEISAMSADIQTQIELSLNILADQFRQPKIWDLIRGI